MHLLFDADVMLWKVTYDATSLPHGRVSFDNLFNSYVNYLKLYFKKLHDVSLFLTSDDKSNFRYRVPSKQKYKGNRVNRLHPEFFFDIKDYVHSRGATMAFGCEADDLITTRATELKDQATIVSNDKDYRQVPLCWHWETNNEEAPYYVTNPGFLLKKRAKNDKNKVFGTGIKWFYFQMLSGDTGDHVPGVKGVGQIKAFEVLDSLTTEKEMWNATKELYLEKGLTEEDALHNGRLLWLKRSIDEPLWSPPIP